MTKAERAPDFSHWEGWNDQQTASAWREALATVKLSLQSYAADAGIGIEISGLRWDAPDITGTWESGGCSRNVQVTLAGRAWPLGFIVRGAAWQDSYPNGKLHRLWTHTEWQSVTAPSPEALRTKLEGAWPEIFAKLQALRPTQPA
ncbi:MAG: hypothetical protein JNK87_31470 [Bryobacterales bacterium]|nr:hypothetical protein [Bryobacterales bacterium]